jgi:hypothetical protein
MNKKWVQISSSQAKIFTKVNKFVIEPLLKYGIIASSFSGFATTIAIYYLIDFIESNVLHGESISETVKWWLLYACFFILPFSLTMSLIWLGTIVEEEVIFNSKQRNLKLILRSRFSQLLKRQGSLKELWYLSRHSKVLIRAKRVGFNLESLRLYKDSYKLYSYSLVIITYSPNRYFEIDCSEYSFYILRLTNLYLKSHELNPQSIHEELDNLEQFNQKELAYLKNLAKKVANFFQIPMDFQIVRSQRYDDMDDNELDYDVDTDEDMDNEF